MINHFLIEKADRLSVFGQPQFEQRVSLICGEVAELSCFQVSQLQTPDANPHQPLYRAVEGIQHTADFSILSFDKYNPQLTAVYGSG